MISDVLSDAADEIRRYRSRYIEYYNSFSDKIEEVLLAMDSLREDLDESPEEPTPLETEG